MSIDNLVSERFGPLQGVRIISSGTLIAEPWAAELASEMGAEVIQIERPGAATADGAPWVSAWRPLTAVRRWRPTGSRNGATCSASRLT